MSTWDLRVYFVCTFLWTYNYFIFFKSTCQKKRSLGKARAAWQSQALHIVAPTANPRTRHHRSPMKKETCTKHPFLKSRNQQRGTRREMTGFVQTQTILITEPCAASRGVYCLPNPQSMFYGLNDPSWVLPIIGWCNT